MAKFINLIFSRLNHFWVTMASITNRNPGIDIEENGRKQLSKLNLNAKAYQFDMRKTMILSGQYLGYMPQSYIQEELNMGEIRIIQPSTLTYQFDLSLVTKKAPIEPNKVELLQQDFNQGFDLEGQ